MTNWVRSVLKIIIDFNMFNQEYWLEDVLLSRVISNGHQLF